MHQGKTLQKLDEPTIKIPYPM